MTHLTDVRPASYPEFMPARLVTGLQEIEKLRPLWEHLANRPANTRFQSFGWNLLAARVMRDRETVVFAVAETDSCAAIIPAVRVGEALSLAGETLFDYRTVLAGNELSALDAAWRKLSELGLPMRFTAYRDATLPPHPQARFEEFVAAPAALRNSGVQSQPRLDRYLRALVRNGCALKRYSAPPRQLLRYIYSEKSKQQGSLFADPLRRELAIEMFSAACTECEVFTLETAGTLVAALVTFLDGDWRHCYTTYFHPAWSKLSPGMVLLHEVVKTTLVEHRDCDLMTGEQDYKTRLANARVQLYRATISVEAMKGTSAAVEAA